LLGFVVITTALAALELGAAAVDEVEALDALEAVLEVVGALVALDLLLLPPQAATAIATIKIGGKANIFGIGAPPEAWEPGYP
jgi:hypothetical protein